jgi:hypothetical protein
MVLLSVTCALLAVSNMAYADPPTESRGSLQQRVAELEELVAALEARLAASTVLRLDGYLELDSTDPSRPMARFSGVNLQVVNGAGSSSAEPNGLGNLIVGYDEPYTPRTEDEYEYVCSLGAHLDQEACQQAGYVWAQQHKSGSHNLIIGPGHRYSWRYGIAAGADNTISNDDASVIGATHALALGMRAIVTGGSSNQAIGNNSAVLGGWGNLASGPASKVSGGVHNSATAQGATVSGGNWNVAKGFNASVSGGTYNTATGSQSTVSGGYMNTADGQYSTVGGGANRNATGESDWVAGSPVEDQ